MMRPPRIRSFSEFVEEEIVIPTGEFAGQKFRISRQPFTALLFDAYDSSVFNTFDTTGPRQSGKTLCGSTIPTMYHLFEKCENVIYGVPDMEMVGDKWREDLLPAIQASRYRDMLPRKGAGSKGGKVRSIKFRNGATLRFMTDNGSDKSRVGFTSPNVVITETDGWKKTEGSEADHLTQIFYCTRSYGERRRIYMECTLTTKQGRTYKEMQAGSASQIAIECPHCLEYVTPERENLVGWQEAEDEITARERAAFACPACGTIWSEEDRLAANKKAVLVHRGQRVLPGGIIEGDPPRTKTLGFRWNPVHNVLLKTADFAQDEWQGAHDADEDNVERRLCQFLWAIPYESKEIDISVINENVALKRLVGTPKGVVPEGTEWLTSFSDIGKWKCHWITVAWKQDFRGVIIDYDFVSVQSNTMEEELAILHALAEYHEIVTSGWIVEKTNEMLLPHQVWIDSRYLPRVIQKFCKEANTKAGGSRFRPSEGFGSAMSEAKKRAYFRPKATSKVTPYVGDEFHIDWDATAGIHVVKVNADHWKGRVLNGLVIPEDKPGAITFYRGGVNEHRTLIRHFTAEQRKSTFVPGKGMMEVFERVRRNNHWFDGLYNNAAAASLCGARLDKPKPQPIQEEHRTSRLTTPDGRPFLVTER